jgi:hypothetical protein
MWFEALTGFAEDGVADVAGRFVVDGELITSKANGRTMRHGRFETPTLHELRQRWQGLAGGGRLRLREVIGDARALHADPANAGALFQVASQFNTLEMISPAVTPEQGIDRYETDLTQGPACAMACGAGTIYRNYLVPLGGHRGQSADRQLDCLADLAAALGVDIEVRNGYALPAAARLDRISELLGRAGDAARNELMGQLRIGLHWDTEVTLAGAGHLVTQAYCSALPLAYTDHPSERLEPFARLVLDAAYEAAVGSVALNAAATGNRKGYLTLLGGGAFGNPDRWIIEAIERSRQLFASLDLDLAVVSHGRRNPALRPLLDPSPA